MAAPAWAKGPLTPEKSLEVRWPSRPVISPDGRWLVFQVRQTDKSLQTTTHLHLMPAAGGVSRILTQTGSNNGGAVWSPDGKRLAFMSNRGGAPQIYLLDLSGGEPTALTQLSTGAMNPLWSPDGKTIAFTSSVYPDCTDDACNARRMEEEKKAPSSAQAYNNLFYRHWMDWDDGRRSHLFVVPVDQSRPPFDVTPGAAHVPSDVLEHGRGFAFLGDDQLIYVAHGGKDRARSTNNDLFQVSVKGGTAKKLTTNEAWDSDPVSQGGRYVAYLTHARPGFEADKTTLTVWDKTTNQINKRTDSLDLPVGTYAWMASGDGLYFTAQRRGHRELFSVGREAGEPTQLTQGRWLSEIAVGPANEVIFIGSSLTEAPELYRWEPATKKTVKLTSLNTALNGDLILGKVQELEANAPDGTKIHGFVVAPAGATPGKKYPVVLILHGGPQGALENAWHPRWNAQLFAAKGYVVAMPNFRGSTGYGQTFTDAISKNWSAPMDDVLAFLDATNKLPFADPKKACAAGASYGGYLANWLAGHTDRFKCLISHAGVFNLESMWGDTEELWFPEWEFGGAPWEQRATYAKYSPHNFIQNAKTPTLVIHGQLDYRVNLSQGLQMFTSLKRLGVPARLVYYPDEGHWVTRPANFTNWYGEMLGWLGKYLP